MSSGWWMTDLLGLQDHVALSSHQVNREIRRPNHSVSSFMSSSSCAFTRPSSLCGMLCSGYES